jgi:hypothetical protein
VLLPEFLSSVLLQAFWVLYDGGIFILVGFAIAGAIHVLLDPDRIVRHLGERSLRSAAIAALLGAPLPLCSCGVLPTALSLRRKGASRESTLSFLITTPETGVDSIAVTWAFFGPLMAVIRPVVAILTGLVAAVFSLRQSDELHARDAAAAETVATDAAVRPHEHAVGPHGHGPEPTLTDAGARDVGRRAKVRLAARYAFVDLFDDLGFWLAFAILLTGVLSALLPAAFFAQVLPGTLLPKLAMIAIGIPLYVCASASTPLAALFVAKGASMGTALVFLLTGPATNAATIGAISRLLGQPFLRVYLGAIIGVALVAGLTLDLVAPDLGRGLTLAGGADAPALGLVKTAGAVALAALLLLSLRRTGLRPGLRELRDNAAAAWGWLRALRPRSIARSRIAQGLLALWLLSLLAPAFVSVPAGAVALVQRFGRLTGAPSPPGLVLALPGIDRVEIVHVATVREETVGYRRLSPSLARTPVLDEATYLTGDENVIDLHAEAQYRVSDPVAFRLGVERPDALLSSLLRSRLLEAMAARPIDRVYTDARSEVEAWLLATVREDTTTLGLGVEVLAVRLVDVHAPSGVHDAFRDVASAHEDRLTTIHRAREYAVGVVALARGEAVSTVARAEAQAAERTASAEGAAAAFRALAAEHHRAPRALEDRLYLEAAERVLPGARKLVRPGGEPGRGYELWLRASGEGWASFPPASEPLAPGTPGGAVARPPTSTAPPSGSIPIQPAPSRAGQRSP